MSQDSGDLTNDAKRQSSIGNIINHNNNNETKRQKTNMGTPTTSILEMNLANARNGAILKTKQSISPNAIGLNHKPVTSCTHCRQHKIKCDANQNYPDPCSRCKKFDLLCEIDAKFTPKKGSQIQIMRKDIDELKVKVKHLLENETLLVDLLKQSDMGKSVLAKWDPSNIPSFKPNKPTTVSNTNVTTMPATTTTKPLSKVSIKTYLANDSNGLPPRVMSSTESDHSVLSRQHSASPIHHPHPPSIVASTQEKPLFPSPNTAQAANPDGPHAAVTTTLPPIPSPFAGELDNVNEFVIGDVHVSLEKATQLHRVFVDQYLPFLTIMFSNSVAELYSQSKLLFWTVMLTGCLSDPEPTLYIKLSSLIKQLAIETCWLRTPRSTHISQALIILSTWPLPNQKVLDDCSYRFINLAKSLSYQLGLHRGEFIYEFTRNQTLMPNAKKWRTRTWLGIFFTEVCWSTILGLPPTSQTDYLVEMAKAAEAMDEKDLQEDIMNKIDDDYDNSKPYTFKLPKRFKNLICLASFQMKLCNIMGSSVISSHGLIEPKDRAGALSVLETELDVINRNLHFEDDIVVHIYYLYVRLNICCFAFLPQTPIEDQAQYITKAYLCATKCITFVSKLLEERPLTSLPIYVRQSITFSGLILFKLQINSLNIDKYLNSARQSIVTVHRLFRNQSSAWSVVENDISRTATMLEKSNMILITHPEVFTERPGIISRIRSHLTGSLFYDFVWCVHEARRREMDPNCNNDEEKARNRDKRLYPLPLYNQIVKEDFETVTQTTPNGTTVTTLVPTSNALKNAEEDAKNKTGKERNTMTINGIPLSMLDETGSVKNYDSLFQGNGFDWSYSSWSSPASTMTPYSSGASLINERPRIDRNVSQQQQQQQQHQREFGPPLSPMTQSLNRMRNPKSLFASDRQQPSFGHRNSLPNVTPSAKSTPGSLAAYNTSNNHNNTLLQQNDVNPNSTNKNSNIDELMARGSMNETGEGGNDTNKRRRKEKKLNSEEALEATYLNDFFQQQSVGWTEGNLNTDDLFGWFDNVNMEPEF